eukprot:EC726017.1.p1 GENE.EC726017.1~~EC726017.1.p1  ORF type:complete len:83 (+),score=2.17 EC726017.1:137-385(+)
MAEAQRSELQSNDSDQIDENAPYMQFVRKKPLPPEPGMCCGGGCTNCVWDMYDRQLARWEQSAIEAKKKWEKEQKAHAESQQ